MDGNQLTISLAESEELEQAGMALLHRMYGNKLGVIPSNPDCLLVGVLEHKVVATIGINHSHDGILAIAARHSVVLHEHTSAIELCRWCAESPLYASQIALGGIRHALRTGATLALVEQRPSVARRTRQLEVTLSAVMGAALDYSKIDREHLRFYTDSPPSLYSIELCTAEIALIEYIQRCY